MRLYNYWLSSASWRVRIAMAYKGVAYEYSAVDLVRAGGEQHGDGYRALNPMEQVPTLEFSVNGTLYRLGQSVAILEYLEETVPTPRLLPEDAWARAITRQMVEIANAGIQPLQNIGVQRYIQSTYGADGRAFAAHWIARGLAAWEALATQHARRYLVGDEVTLADVCLAPQMHAARRMGVDTSCFESLTRVDALCAMLPPFITAHASRQPDAVGVG